MAITSQQIQEAIDRAKIDPGSEYARDLKVRLDTGNFDGQLKELGIKRTSRGLKRKTTIKGFVQEGAQDIKEIGSGIKESFQERGQNVRESKIGFKEGEQGVGRTIFQGLGQGAGFVSDIVGETVIGAGKAVLPQGAEDAIGEKVTDIASNVAQKPVVQDLIKKYEELKISNPAAARDLDAAFGIGGLALDVGLGGAGSKAIKGGARAVGEVAGQAGKQIKKGISLIADTKFKKINIGLKQLDPDSFDGAVKSINDAYKTGFIENKVGTNNKLTKLGKKTGKSPDQLVSELAAEGIIPQVEGKLAKFDSSLSDINAKTREIDATIKSKIKQYKEPTTLEQFSEGIKADLLESADPAQLSKSLKELDRTIESYRAKYGDVLLPEHINEIRISSNKASKAFDREIFEADVSSSIGNASRNRIDEIVPDEVIRKANAESGRLRNLENTIKIFDNQPIDVGVLGTQLGRLGGAMALGGIAAPFSAGGSLVIAGIVATYGGDVVARFLRNRKFSQAARDIIIKELKKQPDVVSDLISSSTTKSNVDFLQKLLSAPEEGAPKSQIGSGKTIELPKESPSTFESRQNKLTQR